MKNLVGAFFFFLFINPVFAQVAEVGIYQAQIAGETATDECVVLVNNSKEEVNLEGWRLSKKTKSGNEYNLLTSFPVRSIPAGGYLSIAHSDYNGQADLFYSTSQSLAKNNSLILYSNGGDTIIDEVFWDDARFVESIEVSEKEKDSEIFNDGDKVVSEHDDLVVGDPPLKIISETEKNSKETSKQETKDKNVRTGNIIISEFLPNPAGDDAQGEWVELQNIDSQAIDISGWSLSDGSRQYFINPENMVSIEIPANGFFVITRQMSKIALNNSGEETLTLKNHIGDLIDIVSYTNDGENKSYAFDKVAWHWSSTMTPGWENIITEPVTVVELEERNEEEIILKQETKNIETNVNKIPTNYDFSGLIFSELLPNPVGDDAEGEWIELLNTTNSVINLNGIKIGDSSSQIFEFSEYNLHPGEFFVLSRSTSKIALNNNGDEVKLWSPAGDLVNSVYYYTSAKEGESYAYGEDGLWDWTQEITPNQKNTFTKVLGKQTAGIESPSISESTPLTKLQDTSTIAEAKLQPLGSTVAVEGIVIAEPSLLAKTYFYIADSESGIQLYFSKADLLSLKRNEHVRVTGQLSDNNGELRIKISDERNIEATGTIAEPMIKKIPIAQISDAVEGNLISISGVLQDKQSTSLYIADEESEIRVYIPQSININTSRFVEGDKVAVTGIVSETKTGFRLLLRASEDIEIVNVEPEALNTKPAIIESQSTKSNLTWYFLILIIGLIGYLIFIFNKRYGFLQLHTKNIPEDDDLFD